MTSQDKASGADQLRMQLKTNARFRLEMLAKISQVAREHGVELSDEVLKGLTLATSDELDLPMSGPNLPGGQ
ncbi:UNVERIFIED_CONTAM: hypothetical protein NY603_34475, partial [Bacteroidetes bacterium 56_B9]